MRIKTICPEKNGGCGREHFLEVDDAAAIDDPELQAMMLRLAGMVGCRPCSIYQENRQRLEDVQNQNKRTIWVQENRRDNAKALLKRNPKNRSDLEARVGECERTIGMARGDLNLAVREMKRLDDAR